MNPWGLSPISFLSFFVRSSFLFEAVSRSFFALLLRLAWCQTNTQAPPHAPLPRCIVSSTHTPKRRPSYFLPIHFINTCCSRAFCLCLILLQLLPDFLWSWLKRKSPLFAGRAARLSHFHIIIASSIRSAFFCDGLDFLLGLSPALMMMAPAAAAASESRSCKVRAEAVDLFLTDSISPTLSNDGSSSSSAKKLHNITHHDEGRWSWQRERPL